MLGRLLSGAAAGMQIPTSLGGKVPICGAGLVYGRPKDRHPSTKELNHPWKVN